MEQKGNPLAIKIEDMYSLLGEKEVKILLLTKRLQEMELRFKEMGEGKDTIPEQGKEN